MHEINSNVKTFDDVRRALYAVMTQLRMDVTDVKTADYSAKVGEYIQVDTSSGDIDITMPLVTTDNRGRLISVKRRTGGNLVKILPSSGNTIDGDGDGQNLTVTNYAATFISNGAGQWQRVSWTGNVVP